MNNGVDKEDHYVPLVWDENTWFSRMGSQEAWPDLQMCVEIYFRSNFGMQSHPQARQNPIPFEWTDSFWKSVDDLCQPPMRQLLVKAIVKKVYGILDSKLHDERIRNFRRFRVTDFWRVNYVERGGRIVLEEFGAHDIGGV